MPIPFDTLYEAFAATSAAAPDHAFLCATPSSGWTVAGKTELTYREAASQVERLRAAYAAAGYGPGHRVALLLKSRPDHFLHLLALNALGVSQVPVNPDYRPDESQYLIEHSESDLIVALPERVADMQAVAARCAQRPPVVDAFALPQALPRPRRPAGPDKPGAATEAALFYTSGTTGRPKGCICTNTYFLNVATEYANFPGVIRPKVGVDRILNPLPTFHQNCGCVTVSMAILTRNCLIVTERFSARHWWRDVAETRATAVHYLGIMVPVLVNLPESPEEKRHTVRYGFGGGVDPALRRIFEQRFGFPIADGWAMTETGNFIKDTVEPRQVDRRAIGRSNEWMECRIVDEADKELPRGTPGELVVRAAGPDPRRGFFAGYLKNPQATAEAWRGGWFHTGDVCLMQDDGMVIFVDRKKNIIRRSGENISGAEIDACLQQHPAVDKVAAIAVRDELREEEVMACVVPKAGVARSRDTAQSIAQFGLERLADYKAPGWVLFVDDLPVTSTQKVQKTQIFAPGTDARALPGAFDLRAEKKPKRG